MRTIAILCVIVSWRLALSMPLETKGENLVKKEGALGHCAHPLGDGCPENADNETDVFTLKSALLMEGVGAEISTVNATLMQKFEKYVFDPYHPDHVHSLPASLLADRIAAENALLMKLCEWEINGSVLPWIMAAVTAKFDNIVQDILNRAEERKRAILDREHEVYEIARFKQVLVRRSLNLNGDGSAVDRNVTHYMRVALAAFLKTAVLPDVEPSPSLPKMVQRLQENSLIHCRAAHDANHAHYFRKRQVLLRTPVPAVRVEILKNINHCPNEHVETSFNLSESFPEYFGTAVRDDLMVVNVTFHGSGGGSGVLNLNPIVGNHLVSTGGMCGKKYIGNTVHYDPATTVLHVVLQGAGFKHGIGYCKNRLVMSKVVLTITRNQMVLPENVVYKQAYAEPEF